MGIHQCPSEKDHWSEDCCYSNNWIKNRISYRKWKAIHLALSYDSDWLEIQLKNSFRKYWQPYEHVTVDEGMIPFKGRFRYRQHVRGKPKATGIKYYALCDEKGYTWWFWTYQGIQPSTSLLVSKFTSMLPHVGYKVYVDSYYGSYGLARKLSKQGHRFTLACQANRPAWLFSGYLMQGLKRGEWKSIYNPSKDMTALSFYDNGKCNFISNIFSGEGIITTSKGKIIPKIVSDYRQSYGFVDRSDSFHLKYLFPHRRRKRTMAQFLSYLKMSVVNAWILYQSRTGEKLRQKDFLRRLIDQISPETPDHHPNRDLHLIVRGDKRTSCSYCWAKYQKASSTVYQCMTCKNYLHPDCFFDFHNQ